MSGFGVVCLRVYRGLEVGVYFIRNEGMVFLVCLVADIDWI